MIFAFVASVSFLLVNVVDPFSGATASPDFAERGERFGGADVQAFDVNGEYTIDVSREGYVVEKKPEVKLAPAATSASSGAYGIPQALPGSKMATAGADWETNAGTQIEWGLGYIQGRYATPCGAWAHSQDVGWY